MPPLAEEESLEITTKASHQLDDIEDAAIRLLPFLTDEKETMGELNGYARMLTTIAFAVNGELIARHCRRFNAVIKKSRSESDLPVSPTPNYVTAMELSTEILSNALSVSSQLDRLYENDEEAPGGEIAKEVDEAYFDAVKAQVKYLIQVAYGVQHSLLLVNAGFDLDGITSAIKIPEANDRSGQQPYLRET